MDYYNINFKTRIEAVKTLIKYGADVNTKASDEYGNTALMYAAWNEQSETEVVKALLKAGADVDAKNNYGGTALMLVHKPESAKALIRAGADIRAKANDGSTVLMCWADNDEMLESIQSLVKAGINVNAKNIHGNTALMKSVLCEEFTGYNKERQLEIVRLS